MVFGKVKEIIIDQLGLAEDTEITTDTSLVNDLDADSLDAVEIIMAIEDEFEVEIPDETAEGFNNIGDIAGYVEDNKKA